MLSYISISLIIAGCNADSSHDYSPNLHVADALICGEHRSTTPLAQLIVPSGTTFVAGQPIITQQGQYQLLLQLPKQGVPLNDYFSLQLAVQDTQGVAPASPLQIELKAARLIYQQGMKSWPVVHDLGAGKFRIDDLLFHVAGEWNLQFDIQQGGHSDSVQIDLQV